MQHKAIECLGLFGGPESRQALSEIYASASDVEAKKAVLRAFMMAGEKARVLAAAKGEADPNLRRGAHPQLGGMGAPGAGGRPYPSAAPAPVKPGPTTPPFLRRSTGR